jgi:glycosyltransferase involved in cell wall biosynthesis
MSKHPSVSVVIPAYNAESYIDDALRSVLGQNYPDIEIIVVDDGSTDGTADRVAAYQPRVHCYRRTNSGGYPGVPRNTGIEHCSGEYVCFLDADDIMVPDRVEKQAGFLSDHPEAGVVFTDYRNFSANGPADRSHFSTCSLVQEMLGGKPSLVLTSEEATGLLLKENFGIPSSLMIRREVLGAVPGFSKEMQVGEDFHFYYRVARCFGVGIVNHVGSLRRLHDTNMTSNTLRMLHNCILSRTRLRDTESDATNRRLLNDFLFQCEIDLARAYANRREIRNAFVHNLRALAGSFPDSLDHLRIGLRTLVRTGTIAVHLKKPDP